MTVLDLRAILLEYPPTNKAIRSRQTGEARIFGAGRKRMLRRRSTANTCRRFVAHFGGAFHIQSEAQIIHRMIATRQVPHGSR
jgi:predicted SpoU family rRNA methylase